MSKIDMKLLRTKVSSWKKTQWADLVWLPCLLRWFYFFPSVLLPLGNPRSFPQCHGGGGGQLGEPPFTCLSPMMLDSKHTVCPPSLPSGGCGVPTYLPKFTLQPCNTYVGVGTRDNDKHGSLLSHCVLSSINVSPCPVAPCRAVY